MIHKFLSDRAAGDPRRTAVIQKRRRVSYGELQSGTLQVGSFLLEHGLQKGDRVCIAMKNSPEYIMSYLGIQKAGGITVPINPQCSAYELKKVLGNCRPAYLIAGEKSFESSADIITGDLPLKDVIVAEEDGRDEAPDKTGKAFSDVRFHSLRKILKSGRDIKNYPSICEKDTASIIYTSGTTGEPKGVTLSHNNFLANARSIIHYLKLTPDDRIMVVLPFYYSYGMSLLTTHLMAGGSLVLENTFMYPNVILDRMLEEDVTGFAGVPSTFAILLNRSNIRKYRFPGLKYVTQAGGAMSPAHAKEIAGILSNTDIYIMYGQTEATARLAYLDPKDFFRKPGSIGRAIPGVRLELIKEDGTPASDCEEGEIVAQGENIMAGYWGNPEETGRVLRDGRLFTGDMAVRDEEGCLRITGRRSDIIKSGAHRISPTEIEEVILEMPEVCEAAVVGMEDEILGTAVKAVIVARDGSSLEPQKVQKHCRQKLAPFKIPKEVVFVREIPKTASGKVQRYLLKEKQAT